MAPSNNTAREAREARERLRRYNARQSVHTHQLKRRRRDNIVAVAGFVVIAALATSAQLFYFNGGPGTADPTPSASATPTPTPTAAGENVGEVPSPDLAENREWTGTLTLNDTPLAISLDGAAAPQGVASFINDAQTGFLVGTTCHRLTDGEDFKVLQCGAENPDGAIDGSYSFGPIENAPADNVYAEGSIALARIGGDAYSQGHQFFIVYGDTTIGSDAAGGYSVIGTVTSGLDELETSVISGGQTPRDPAIPTDGVPNIPTSITAVTVQ